MRHQRDRDLEDRLNQSTIVVIGNANMDIVVPVERFPRAGETITGGDLALLPGGKGANQACACSKLGAKVALIAQVGGDAFGAALLGSLRQAGVNMDHVGVCDRASGCASIYVLPGGENTIVISSGANATLDPETAVSRLDAIGTAAFVLTQLEIPLETVAAVLSWAKSRGATTILDPVPACPLSASLLRNVDFLTPNQSEAAVLLDNPSDGVRSFRDAEQAAVGLLALGPSAVVIKLGALGCLVATSQTRTRVKGFRVPAVGRRCVQCSARCCSPGWQAALRSGGLRQRGRCYFRNPVWSAKLSALPGRSEPVSGTCCRYSLIQGRLEVRCSSSITYGWPRSSASSQCSAGAPGPIRKSLPGKTSGRSRCITGTTRSACSCRAFY